MNQRRSLVNWFLPQVDEVNEDEGQRAVRDTQDTVEVLLLRKCDDGIHLLPAVHQQSKGQGVAQKYQTDPSSRMTFGRACRRITPDPEQAKGVLRRLRVVESASDFNGVVRGVRTLIMLMRGADVQIDYGSLARDLYLIQLPSQRGKVFQSWGRDYYYSKQSSNNNR